MTALSVSIFAVLFCALATAYSGWAYDRHKSGWLFGLFGLQLFLLGFNVSILLEHLLKALPA